MQRITIDLTDEQAEILDRLCRTTKLSKSAVVRCAIGVTDCVLKKQASGYTIAAVKGGKIKERIQFVV